MTPAEKLAHDLGAPVMEVDGVHLVPMLCERETETRALERPGWIYELKLDGVRIVADKRADKVTLTYRKLRDAGPSYPEIVDALRGLTEERLVLDGEIVAFDANGRPDFQLLGRRIQAWGRDARRAAQNVPVVYIVFDILAIGPHDLRRFPLEARKEILARVVPESGAANGLLRLHPTFDDGRELFRLCREHRLEGVVAKKKGSTYRTGERSTDWLKVKCELDADLVVIGWTEGEGRRSALGALEVGSYENGRLVVRGRVGSGLDDAMIEILLKDLRAIEVDGPVAHGKLSPKKGRHYVKPEMVISVRYGGFSNDEGTPVLRFPVFRGVRPDVRPEDCTLSPDEAAPVSQAMPEAERMQKARRILLTAPETSVLGEAMTKRKLAQYFESIAPRLLKEVEGRPCALVRPNGEPIWPPPRWTPAFIRTTSVRAGSREIAGWVIDSLDALAFVVESGAATIMHGPYREDAPHVADFFVVRVTSADAEKRHHAARRVRSIIEKLGVRPRLPCSRSARSSRSSRRRPTTA